MTVDLPQVLAEGVERLLQNVAPRDLSRASADLSEKYRQKRERRAPIARSEAEIVAYAAVRPADLRCRVVGAWRRPRAATELAAPYATRSRGAGRDRHLERGDRLAVSGACHRRRGGGADECARTGACAEATHTAVRDATWVRASVTQPAPAGPYDLVLLAYVLGELDARVRTRPSIGPQRPPPSPAA